MANRRSGPTHAAGAEDVRGPSSAPSPSSNIWPPVVETPEVEVRTTSTANSADMVLEEITPEAELAEVTHEAACPHCGGKRVVCSTGGNPHKPAGSLHCNECGCCFQPDGVTLRAGHPPCTLVTGEPG
jgi:hypothetical protein